MLQRHLYKVVYYITRLPQLLVCIWSSSQMLSLEKTKTTATKQSIMVKQDTDWHAMNMLWIAKTDQRYINYNCKWQLEYLSGISTCICHTEALHYCYTSTNLCKIKLLLSTLKGTWFFKLSYRVTAPFLKVIGDVSSAPLSILTLGLLPKPLCDSVTSRPCDRNLRAQYSSLPKTQQC